MIICFEKVPEIGTIISSDSGLQQYTLIMVESYVRKDKLKSAVLTWQAKCTTCDVLFNITTGLKAHNINRRCPKHHKPFKSADKEWWQRFSKML